MMNYIVLKISTQFHLIYKVQNQTTGHDSTACKLINNEGNELPVEDVHI